MNKAPPGQSAEEVARISASVESFIRQHLVERRDRFRRFPLPGNEDPRVTRVVSFEDDGLFRQSRVVRVFVSSCDLEGLMLPSGGSFGLFAVGGAELRYLNRRPTEVEALLREEGWPLDAAAPEVLAELFAEALLQDGNTTDDVLRSAEALAAYDGGQSPSVGGRYEVDAAEWRRVLPDFTPPSIDRRGAGWIVDFCTLHGSMHDKGVLRRHAFHVDADRHIRIESRNLSPKIFQRSPMVLY